MTMKNEYKTLRELDVKPGDVVMAEHTTDTIEWVGPRTVRMETGVYWDLDGDFWCIVSRASDTPKLWGDMTPEEKGALLLAHHEGKVIQLYMVNRWFDTTQNKVGWHSSKAYRVRPEPDRETVTLTSSKKYYWVFELSPGPSDTHRITFDLIDGVPDCASIRMESIND